MLISLLLITYSALSVSQYIYFACDFQQTFIDEHFYLHGSKKKKRISTYFDAHLPVSLLITYSALSVSQHIYFACDFQQKFVDEHLYLHQF